MRGGLPVVGPDRSAGYQSVTARLAREMRGRRGRMGTMSRPRRCRRSRGRRRRGRGSGRRWGRGRCRRRVLPRRSRAVAAHGQPDPRCHPSGQRPRDAIDAGRVRGDGDADHNGADRPERREQGEAGQHPETGQDRMPADEGGRRWRRGGTGGAVVCEWHVTTLCDGAGQFADQRQFMSGVSVPVSLPRCDAPVDGRSPMSRHNRGAT